MMSIKVFTCSLVHSHKGFGRIHCLPVWIPVPTLFAGAKDNECVSVHLQVLKYGLPTAVFATSRISGVTISIHSSKKHQTTRGVPLENCGL